MALHGFLQGYPGYADTQALGAALKALQAEGLDQLPLPGSGQTLERLSGLAQVAGHDLRLCKLFEGHTDALAIIAELRSPLPPLGSTWGMWAAEPPTAKVRVRRDGSRLILEGRKAWCSGAAVVSHGLLTAWDEQDRQQLVAVQMHQPGITVTDEGWNAVGMAATGSVEILFDNALGIAVGAPGDYLARPGFWHGGIGIAACWYGAAQRLAEVLRAQCSKRPEPHALAHLGAVDSALNSAACVLRASAAQIDRQPQADARQLAQQVRAALEDTVEQVMRHVGRATGAGPYCKDPHFAQLMADLPVFVRQSHAERDLAALGEQVAGGAPGRWQL
ncbi:MULTISPECIES: acyl-CoA dehydrogenase family protein [Pseudomonas]|jgi:alkylation response protein AidB-like acyl-CoA dehydrogenase|uniref:Acyl-CoA dehydrogenase n=2 Tax=Pseudomonas TaxID=286 RepID=A0A7M2J105_PSEFL|nr:MULTISPECIES: acyl-CoA dehydrogenase family protein [Pseudomonas]AHC36093.1 acyl-CoA dehydrogenase [Pseudomonas sp. TKP]MBL1306977.1 acyl-CoA dehydrogenase [Pseudomonas sp.]MDR6580105.1 alkylation response protein AidB-like acyl-CoA dehydrogenase [Pseudomonas extremaustralis]PMX14675.1 acyl-CoA dehydrogenase [Pseudomonas sp. MPBC4-3]PMX29343.1 acyl-CoA dehydrogenase [Pseudomonas sp. GW460-12]